MAALQALEGSMGCHVKSLHGVFRVYTGSTRITTRRDSGRYLFFLLWHTGLRFRALEFQS